MPKSNKYQAGPLTIDEAFEVIRDERRYQDAVWCAATTPTEGNHSPAEFLLYMQHYINEGVREASTQADPHANIAVLDNIRKIAALAVSAMEQNGATHRNPEQFPKEAPVVNHDFPDDEIPF